MISKQYFNRNHKCHCYCMTPELIENYDLAIADKENVWICHHRKEEFYTSKELIEMGMYYNVPPEDLVFCRNKKEHYKYPHKGFGISEETKKKISESSKGKKMSEEAKKKISESEKGKEPWNKGKSGIYSEDTLRKMSDVKKGKKHSEEAKKKMSEEKKGKKGFTNGIINVFDFTCPPGFWPGVTRHKH